ncbi:MAG: potassium-transporting ATPase subunit F [Dehalococcoidia bacterium]|jgi:K+-transporting ATPase KdpF subunit
MTFEYWLGLVVAVATGAYVLFALVRPERF